nr:hypothetical protein [Tanacetum cinerariifolium]
MMKLEKSIGVSRSSLNDERASVCLDAERFEQLVDRRHLFQKPDVRVPPSD